MEEDMKETMERVDRDDFYEKRGLAECGRPQCGGCYEVEPGKKIHPPKDDGSFAAWQNSFHERKLKLELDKEDPGLLLLPHEDTQVQQVQGKLETKKEGGASSAVPSLQESGLEGVDSPL